MRRRDCPTRPALTRLASLAPTKWERAIFPEAPTAKNLPSPALAGEGGEGAARAG
jgi:hypothetical protein